MFPRPLLLMSFYCSLLLVISYIQTNVFPTSFLPYIIVALLSARTKMPALSSRQAFASCISIVGCLITAYLHFSNGPEYARYLEHGFLLSSLFLIFSASIISFVYSYFNSPDTYDNDTQDSEGIQRQFGVNNIKELHHNY